MTARPPLAVWLYGTKVATLAEGRGIELAWTDDAYDRWGGGSRVVSQLLPISTPRQGPSSRAVNAFLDGLLPEGNALLNYALDAGLAPDDTYGLISRYGRDTAGALVFQPLEEPEPTQVGWYEPLSAAEVGRRLLHAERHAPTDPSARGIESSSLAGMQPKITLHRSAGRWQACRSGAPSTWIVKLAHPEGSAAEDVVDTEVLAIELARELGLTSITAELVDLGGVRAIVVARYDRRETAAGIERIHQEDLAQALGLNTRDPTRKFQRGSEIPSLRAAAQVLRDGGSEPDELLALTTFNHVIGNTDFHAKNLSFLRHADGTASLAPAYDVALHLHHGGERLSALDVNGKFRMAEIGTDDLVAEGRSWGLPQRRARTVVTDTVDALVARLADVDPAGHPGVTADALETARNRAGSAARSLRASRVVDDGPSVAAPAPSATAVTGDAPGAIRPHRRGPRR